MNFKELLKKYWFVGVVALALVVFIGAYGVDAYKNREVTVSSKTVDGKSVAYSVNDEFGYADDLYETLYSTNGLMMSFNAYQRAVLGKAYETTDEMSNRGEGINNWLKAHSHVKDWIVIDDEMFNDYENYNIVDKLIKTKSFYGLTEEDAEKAIEILGGKEE